MQKLTSVAAALCAALALSACGHPDNTAADIATGPAGADIAHRTWFMARPAVGPAIPHMGQMYGVKPDPARLPEGAVTWFRFAPGPYPANVPLPPRILFLERQQSAIAHVSTGRTADGRTILGLVFPPDQSQPKGERFDRMELAILPADWRSWGGLGSPPQCSTQAAQQQFVMARDGEGQTMRYACGFPAYLSGTIRNTGDSGDLLASGASEIDGGVASGWTAARCMAPSERGKDNFPCNWTGAK